MNAPANLRLDHPFDAPPALGEAIVVAPGIRWLRMPLPFALDHINLWLVDGDDGVAIVDSGYGDSVTRDAWQRHVSTTMADRSVRALVATHYHPDHLGNAEWLAARFGVQVTMTHAEFLHARSVWRDEAPLSVASYTRFLRAHGMTDEHARALDARGGAYRRGVPTLPDTFARLIDGDDVDLAGVSFRVIAGFGHSPEHAALHCAGRATLISGDMLLPRISTNISAWPGEPDGDPLQRFLDSLSRFEHLAPETLVLPSHGLPFRGIALRVAQLRAHHHARLAELEEFVRHAPAPVSAADVLPTLFRRELDLQQRFFAMGEAIAHLNHLWHRRRIERTTDAQHAVRFRVAP